MAKSPQYLVEAHEYNKTAAERGGKTSNFTSHVQRSFFVDTAVPVGILRRGFEKGVVYFNVSWLSQAWSLKDRVGVVPVFDFAFFIGRIRSGVTICPEKGKETSLGSWRNK